MADHTATSPATEAGSSEAAGDAAARRLLGLPVEPAEMRGSLEVVPALLNTAKVLWGSCGPAAAIAVGEQVLERDALWATVQYVRPFGE